MICSIRKAVVTAVLGALLVAPVSGCAGRPAPRPEAAAPSHTAVAGIASSVSGAGRTAAVMLGKTALIALQLDDANPGGTDGGSITGRVTDAGDGTVSQGPSYVHGPGGSQGASPAMPGGAINPGGSTPGGSPVHEQAAPNGKGGLASTGGPHGTGWAQPSSYGSTPLDVMNRVADRVKAEYPAITEVRFATTPADARRLEEIARDLSAGGATDRFGAELQAIAGRAMIAGTTRFSPTHPTQGSDSAP